MRKHLANDDVSKIDHKYIATAVSEVLNRCRTVWYISGAFFILLTLFIKYLVSKCNEKKPM